MTMESAEEDFEINRSGSGLTAVPKDIETGQCKRLRLDRNKLTHLDGLARLVREHSVRDRSEKMKMKPLRLIGNASMTRLHAGGAEATGPVIQ